MVRVLLVDYDWKSIQSSYDSGKSWDELCAIYGTSTKSLSKANKLGLFKTRSQSQGQKLRLASKPRIWSPASRQKMSEHAKRRGLGGQNFGRQIIYKGIALDSSYELKMAKELDLHSIEWIRPSSLPWIDDSGSSRKYYPDFFLPSYNVYLYPKNSYLMNKDARKIELVREQNKVVVILLSENMLTWEYVLSHIRSIDTDNA